MHEQDFRELLEKYHQGTASDEERTLIESWYLSESSKEQRNPVDDELLNAEQKISGRIAAITGIPLYKHQVKPIFLWPRLAVAASILLIVSIGTYFFVSNKLPVKQTASVRQDIAPGSNKATLTLANGKTIILDNNATGTIANQGTTKILKTSGGQVVYKADGLKGQAISYNTLTTPKGGEYQVVLPDGTHVWLNAASSITYPTTFTNGSRKVSITGEAYFEVAHNKAKPFHVKTASQTVEVLGTHFDIMAYSDEPAIKTTLLEGSVKVSEAGNSKIIAPGEQAVVKDAIQVVPADTELAVAWKDGRTSFKDADIPTLMRSLSRWYNVEVEYRGNIPQRIFTGGIPRKSNLSTMLRILAEMNIHAHIEGRKIIVTPS